MKREILALAALAVLGTALEASCPACRIRRSTTPPASSRFPFPDVLGPLFAVALLLLLGRLAYRR